LERDERSPHPASLDEVMERVKMAVLQNVRMQHRAAEAATANRIEAIRMALDLDATWADIGAAMGMSRQLAHRRFGNGVRGTTAIRRKH
jgi:hypothetical protein